MKFKSEAIKAIRKTLKEILSGNNKPEIKFEDEIFKQNCGVFVTLKKSGELRGCIGFIRGIGPLSKTLQEAAIAAALNDPRFPPVTLDELEDIEIEISILSPMEEVRDINEIEIGKHGLMLTYKHNSGLLLPQVPIEWNWNIDEYLHHLCLKAGLPPGSHLNPEAKLFKFTAEIINENEINK